MGEVDPTLSLIWAARYAGVPPWELRQQSKVWIREIMLAQATENAAQEKAEAVREHKQSQMQNLRNQRGGG